MVGGHRPSKQQLHQNRRKVKQFRLNGSAKRREHYGAVATKQFLRTSLLNVDGLSESSLDDIRGTIKSQKPDIVFILETKRRQEECHDDVTVPGYALHEALRSNISEDKEGGVLQYIPS